MKVSSLHIYPIKSCAGFTVESAAVFSRGLQHDRRWMIVDETGKFMTQRDYPALALIKVEITKTGLHLTAPGCDTLEVSVPPQDTAPLSVQVWKSALELPEAIEAARWLSTYLGKSSRLVHLPDHLQRLVTSSRARAGDEVSLADGFPILITTIASLSHLNSRMPAPLPMDRFRPNLVVDGATAWDEDSWLEVQIGDIRFELLKPCSRCNMTQIDQARGVEDGKEPIRTLRQFRFSPLESGVLFGMNAIARRTGYVKLGDNIEVLTRQAVPELRVRA